jgi:uncharacterized protein (UPF0335 family)
MNNNKEIVRLKAAVADLVDAIQAIHRQRRELDARAAEIYQKGRHEGLRVKVIKEALRTQGNGEAASFDSVWQAYAAALGINENTVADDFSALDAILGRPA